MTPDRWRQIEDLYHAAQKCPPNERAALLEGTDPEIRSRVERMLEVESGSAIFNPSSDGFLADATRTVIASGEQLGPYRIEAQIGAGGMGTVYRAVDTRLGRVVAIKIAAERYSVRFQLEARAISTLNHPNVCTLYDVGPNYLVMEFIEGSTLAAELKKGPLVPELAARYGAQIAGALAEAHSLGIVHRDLKPSNIMLTRHGVKVLDFGLAKVLSTTGITETNAVMGTPAYMAPEQVDGREPGTAADLFSLGLVLYEMAVGKLPYPGASLGQMLSSGAQTAVPAPSRERVGVPASLDPLVARLLEKDPARRPQSAADVSRELAALADRLAAPPRSPFRAAFIAIPAVALLLGLATWLYLRSKEPAPQPPIPNPSTFTQLTSFTDSAVWPVLSPDGHMLAFYRSPGWFFTPDQIWVKLLPDGDPVQITHDSRQKYGIAFSPDGARIAYSVTPRPPNLFQTYTVSPLGGDAELFLQNSAGLTWLDNGRVLFSQVKGAGVHMGVVTSKTDGSDLREIYLPAHDRGMAHYSYLSPDGKWVLMVEMISSWKPCRVVPFAGGSMGRQVGPPDAPCEAAAWSPDGKWMYLDAQVAGRYHLWRQRFPDGQPEQITFGSSQEDGIAMAPDGRSLITSISTPQYAVWVHDARGDRAVSTEGYVYRAPLVFSRDGKRLYYLLRRDSPESPAELWRADLASATSAALVPGVSMSEYDISPDEKDVVFSRQPPGQASEIWIASLDRSSPPHRISAAGDSNPYFGPHGEVLFRLAEGSSFYLAAMQRDGTGRRKAFPDRIVEINGVSADRRFIEVGGILPGPASTASRPELAVPLDGGAPRPMCDCAGGIAWAPDGRYLYVQIASATSGGSPGKTAAIPVPPGQTLPPLPENAVRNPAEWVKIPGVKIVNHDGIAPGPDPSIYAYVKSTGHANLYRVPLR
ncbi:MAG: protein kinase domain-containing protein [Bryobacteraceae bacterium]